MEENKMKKINIKKGLIIVNILVLFGACFLPITSGNLIENYNLNNPPNKPIIKNSAWVGKLERMQNYIADTTDPDDDEIYYRMDFGDGNITNWFGPFYSGEGCVFSYNFSSEGNYSIRAQAKDIHDNESDWSDPFNVFIISVNSLKKTFLLGLVYDVEENRDFYLCKAKFIIHLSFNPLVFMILKSDELIIINDDYHRLPNKFLFLYWDIFVINEWGE
jgi:hypothetical protein